MTPEGKVKKLIKTYLSSVGAYLHMPVQNGMGQPSLDFIGCYRGFFFAIEAKAPGKGPSKRQELTIAKMAEAGATVFVIDGDLSDLQQWVLVVNTLMGSAIAVRDPN